MRSRLPFVAATVVAFSLGTLAWLWPLVPGARTSFLQAFHDPTPLGRADTMLTSWMLAWATHAVWTNPLGLFHANILYPLPWTFALSENMLAGVLLVSPLHLATGDPVLHANMLLAATFVLTGVGTALLVRELGGGVLAAWVAGVIFAFNPFRFASIGHLQILSTHWMPFALLAVHRCLRTGRGTPLVFVGVLLVLLSSVYYVYFFGLALAVLMAAHWLAGSPAAPGGRRRVVAGTLLAGAAIVPVLVPYAIARELYALGRSSGEAWFLSARGTTYLGALTSPLTYATRRYVLGDAHTILGIGALALAAVGVVAGAPSARGGRRTTTAYLAVAIAMSLVSLGPLMQWHNFYDPNLPGPWHLLGTVVPGFSALRVPMRASMTVVLATAVIAGLGMEALWRRSRTPGARAATLGLALVVAVTEAWRPSFASFPVPWATTGVPPVYRWLAAAPGPGAIVELPFGLPINEASYMLHSTVHWRGLVNGYSGFTPTAYFFRGLLAGFPDDESLRLLHAIGVRWVVVHPRDLRGAPAGLCTAGADRLGPHLAMAYRDVASCVLEIRSAPPAPPPPPPDRAISLAGATVTTSAGSPADAALDGRLDTHWTEPVDLTAESWLQLDLPALQPVSRIVLHLGGHFGEYLRQWRIDASLDGSNWRVAGAADNATAPLLALGDTPDHLSTELRLDVPTMARHLRIVRVENGNATPVVLAGNWAYWGAHELEVFATER